MVRGLSAPPVPSPPVVRGPVREIARSLDVADGVLSIEDAPKYDSLRLRVSWAGRPVGTVRIAHQGAVMSPLWVGDEIAQRLTESVLDAGLGLGPHVSRALLTADVTRYIVSRWGADLGRVAPTSSARTSSAA